MQGSCIHSHTIEEVHTGCITLGNYLHYDSAVPFMGSHPKEMSTYKNIFTRIFMDALPIRAQNLK